MLVWQSPKVFGKHSSHPGDSHGPSGLGMTYYFIFFSRGFFRKMVTDMGGIWNLARY